jgi:hypothetical protein
VRLRLVSRGRLLCQGLRRSLQVNQDGESTFLHPMRVSCYADAIRSRVRRPSAGPVVSHRCVYWMHEGGKCPQQNRVSLNLPAPSVSTAIHVEYLSRDLVRVCQIEHSVDNVFHFRDFPHWLSCLK